MTNNQVAKPDSRNKKRIKQATDGSWYFKFVLGADKYFQNHFETFEQAEQALMLQYKILNLTTTGQKRNPFRTRKNNVARKPAVIVERNIYLTHNNKYKVLIQAGGSITRTFDTLDQARTFRNENKKPRKQRACKPREARQLKTKPTKITSFAEKKEQVKQTTIRKSKLNKDIAELNNATRVLIAKTTPTIAELSRIAKTKANPRQYYIEQLKAGAYRG